MLLATDMLRTQRRECTRLVGKSEALCGRTSGGQAGAFGFISRVHGFMSKLTLALCFGARVNCFISLNLSLFCCKMGVIIVPTFWVILRIN